MSKATEYAGDCHAMLHPELRAEDDRDAIIRRPAAYRAAIATADVALAHLPRFVIYNGLNAWGKHREVPHPPKQTFHSWYKANRGDAL